MQGPPPHTRVVTVSPLRALVAAAMVMVVAVVLIALILVALPLAILAVALLIAVQLVRLALRRATHRAGRADGSGRANVRVLSPRAGGPVQTTTPPP